MARHSSPRGQADSPSLRSPFAPLTGGLAGFGVPALAGAGGPGLLGAGPRFVPARPAPRPVDVGRSAAFVGGSADGRAPLRSVSGGRAPALPARAPGGLRPSPAGAPGPSHGHRRATTPLTGRLAVAAVAAGALATAGHSVVSHGLDAPTGETQADLALSAGSSTAAVPGAAAASPAAASSALDAATTGVMAVAPAPTAPSQVSSLSKARQAADAATAREAAARAPQFVKPAEGRFTSGFGARWGTSHRGIDIANAIGTPIVSVANGTVVESGPASGFGMWVRVQLEDGTINVYGHVNRSFVTEGQQVKAGEEIAEIGNRGQSTGPHLHFEVWTPDGAKINPLPWLAERGISLGAAAD
ncbi:M23 family metallopeptidase [Actinomycetospora chiangmaiensis]|uniref:M23 family metallopeptidase n=1 Tax=Actinomycetospora chiangmaiensis TaxID=402650 RepID=UPI0003820356|nr:M23 family metallopeptidase [Actinomycetospora chiangmaiensis]